MPLPVFIELLRNWHFIKFLEELAFSLHSSGRWSYAYNPDLFLLLLSCQRGTGVVCRCIFWVLIKSWNYLAHLTIHEIRERVHLEKKKINYNLVSMKTVFIGLRHFISEWHSYMWNENQFLNSACIELKWSIKRTVCFPSRMWNRNLSLDIRDSEPDHLIWQLFLLWYSQV